MVRVNYAWLLVLILLVPASIAVTVDSLEFYRNGAPVTMVSTQNDRLADMKLEFTVTGDFQQISVDLSELVQQNPVRTLTNSQCRDTGVSYVCEIADLRLQPSSGSGSIPFDVTTASGVETATLTYDFEVDNTQPRVAGIYTEGCEGECYIGPNSKVLIEMEDDTATFEQGFIFYSVNGAEPRMVRECEGMTCEADVSVSCQQGASVQLDIVSYNLAVPSQDDAGNAVNYTNGLSAAMFTCDNTAPTIEHVSVETSSGDSVITQGESVTITVTGQEATSMTGWAGFSTLSGVDEKTEASCSSDGVDYECSFTFSADADPYKKANIELDLRDNAGNAVFHNIELELLEDEVEIDDAWYVRSVHSNPLMLNRQTLQLFDRRIYAVVDFAGASNNQELVGLRSLSCQSDEGLAFDTSVASLGENPVLELIVPSEVAGVDDDKVMVECSVTVDGKRRFQALESEEESFSFEIGLDDFPDMPAKVEEELKSLDGRREKYEKTFGTVKKWSDLFLNACRATSSLKALSAAMTGVEVAACAIPGGQGFAEAAKGTADTVSHGADTVWRSIGKFCDFMTCEDSGILLSNSEARDWAFSASGLDDLGVGNPDSKQIGRYASLGLTKEELFRPENSLVWSAATGCIPGVLSNLEKQQVIQCEYARCLQDDSLRLGLPSAACREARSVNECQFTVGQATNAIPYTQVWNQVGNYIGQVLTNPMGLLGLGVGLLNCPSQPVCGSHPVCSFANAAESIGAIKGIFTNVGKAKTALSSISDESPPICEQVKDYEDLNLYDINFESATDNLPPEDQEEFQQLNTEINELNAFKRTLEGAWNNYQSGGSVNDYVNALNMCPESVCLGNEFHPSPGIETDLACYSEGCIDVEVLTNQIIGNGEDIGDVERIEREKRAERQEKLEEYSNEFGSPEYVAEAIRTGIGFAQAGSWISWGSDVDDWMDGIQKPLASVFNAPEQLFCRQSFDYGTIGAIPAQEGLAYRPAIHLEGYAQEQASEYAYVITAVAAPPEGENLQFSIIARAEGLDDYVVQDSTTATMSSPYSKARSDALRFTSPEYYEEVCFHFNSINQGSYKGLSLESGRYCNDFKEVEDG